VSGLAALSTFASGLDHPEGVTVTVDGTIYAGGEAGQIYRITRDGSVDQVATTEGFALGLASDASGLLYVCDLVRHAVMRVDPASGVVSPLTVGTHSRAMQTPNMLAFDSHGSLYVTDSGEWGGDDGVVYRVTPDGETEVWSTVPSRFPNGCCISADGGALLVVETLGPALWRIEIQPDASAGVATRVAALPACVPDGVASCEDGSAVVACYRPDRVLHVGSSGGVSILADDPSGVTLAAPTNLVFLGDERDQAVIANLGRWHLAIGDLGVRGAPLHYPAQIRVL
jgi:gluconolactonase